MPPKRSSDSPRSYGRQAEGRTIKSLSLSSDVAAWAEEQATIAGMSFSAWLERELNNAKRNVIEEETAPPPAPPEQRVKYKRFPKAKD